MRPEPPPTRANEGTRGGFGPDRRPNAYHRDGAARLAASTHGWYFDPMRWVEARALHPDRWLLIEALDAHTENHRRIVDRLAVLEACPNGATALERFRALHREHSDRELYFVHTGNAALEIEERPWIGIRRNDASHAAR